ncbi:MAG TPA: sugar ABC transporter permease [Acidimicrobiia bacterium]|jgi:D-xylose transport system permease protein
MTEVADVKAEMGDETAAGAAAAGPRSVGGLLRKAEIDLRLVGMVLALIAILIGFTIATNGRILQPVNLVNLSVQMVSIAVIATGMTMVIASRNIDLSVGSIAGLVALVSVVMMVRVLPGVIGLGHPLMWVSALLIGLAVGALLGSMQGYLIAYIGIPSFVVTLGGLLAFRGLTWVISRGSTVAPVDATFRLLGGGPRGSVGATASWILGILASAAIIALLLNNRRQRRRFGFPLRPVWAEVTIGTLAVGAVLGIVWVFNKYFWPEALARRYAEENGIPIPEGGLHIAAGIPWPVIVLVGVTIAMTFIATRTRFGRYVFAYGGNPEAAELSGIKTKWTIMKTFMLIGILCAISGSIAAARLDGATLDLGIGYELYVIAACVIGGTSFSGGVGTIPGAVLGALVLSSLSYGLNFMGVESPIQDIVAGIVLVVAVGFDTYSRRRQAR